MVDPPPSPKLLERRHFFAIAAAVTTGTVATMAASGALFMAFRNAIKPAKRHVYPASPPVAGFDPLPVPGPNDWLTSHPEPGQTFAQFVESNPLRPEASNRALALGPLGDLPGVPLELLRAYVEAFFQMPTRLLPAMSIEDAHARTRIPRGGTSADRQLLTTDVLATLRQRRLPDVFATCAITRADLYPEDAYNYVFGQASTVDRVGVFSFARYEPASPLFTRRCLNILAHETGHMFGLQHCVYYSCIMNGVNTLAEDDRLPFHACPVCLQKLQSSIGFDIGARYADLASFFQASQIAAFADEARWNLARRAT